MKTQRAIETIKRSCMSKSEKNATIKALRSMNLADNEFVTFDGFGKIIKLVVPTDEEN